MSAEFLALVVIVCSVKFLGAGGRVGAFGDLDLGDLEVVLGLAGGVGAEEEAVGCVGFVFVPGCG